MFRRARVTIPDLSRDCLGSGIQSHGCRAKGSGHLTTTNWGYNPSCKMFCVVTTCRLKRPLNMCSRFRSTGLGLSHSKPYLRPKL